MTLLHPTFFSPIIQYVGIVQSAQILFEVEDNFQKQTYRNRCYINTANGKYLLNVPFQHTKGIKQKTKDVKIDYKDNWVDLHLKTLKTAYNSSPFFEFYVDDLTAIYKKKFTYLLDLNLKTHQFVMDALQLEIPFSKTNEYYKEFEGLDLRHLVNDSKNNDFKLDSYFQVFDQNHKFIPNLSILDLIFNEGPTSESYLNNQKFPF
ncbi:WbqC family protein [Lutibacter sp.]|uniref:WbqC family protein n=1 Tax=Lutibacter sp. TaxID=1925666 RepID=UPI0035683E6A